MILHSVLTVSCCRNYLRIPAVFLINDLPVTSANLDWFLFFCRHNEGRGKGEAPAAEGNRTGFQFRKTF